MITSLYTTLADVRSELNSDSTVDDKKIMRGIRQLSRRIDKIFRASVSWVVPSLFSRAIPLSGTNVNSWDRTLILRGTDGVVFPLLSPTSVTINGHALDIGTVVQAYPPLSSPIGMLQLIGEARYSWYTSCCGGVPLTAGVQYATIAGIWGYNVDYANAWLAVDALDAAIDASVTTLTVDDVSGDNPYGESPRISAGHVLQIDDEWMDVIDTDPDTNTLTVLRGVNGSTAAAHTMGATVSVYLVDENIRRICRQAAFQYARIGAFDTTRITDFSTIQFPSDLLQEITDLFQLFANG